MNETIQLLHVLTNLPLLALVMVRIGGMVAFTPFFNDAQIPVRTRALLVAAVGLIVLPFTADQVVPGDLGSLVPAMIGEVLIGLVFGLMLTIVFSGLELAGLLIGQQLGTGLAQVFNPLFEEETSVLGQLYFWLALLIFLLIRGHLLLIGALIRSFQTIPIGKFAVDEQVLATLTAVLKTAFVLALQVAAPILVAIFLASLALGFVGRTVPQLNILSVGFSLRALLGMILVVICLPLGVQVFFEAMEVTFAKLYRLLGL